MVSEKYSCSPNNRWNSIRNIINLERKFTTIALHQEEIVVWMDIFNKFSHSSLTFYLKIILLIQRLKVLKTNQRLFLILLIKAIKSILQLYHLIIIILGLIITIQTIIKMNLINQEEFLRQNPGVIKKKLLIMKSAHQNFYQETITDRMEVRYH